MIVWGRQRNGDRRSVVVLSRQATVDAREDRAARQFAGTGLGDLPTVRIQGLEGRSAGAIGEGGRPFPEVQQGVSPDGEHIARLLAAGPDIRLRQGHASEAGDRPHDVQGAVVALGLLAEEVRADGGPSLRPSKFGVPPVVGLGQAGCGVADLSGPKLLPLPHLDLIALPGLQGGRVKPRHDFVPGTRGGVPADEALHSSRRLRSRSLPHGQPAP